MLNKTKKKKLTVAGFDLSTCKSKALVTSLKIAEIIPFYIPQHQEYQLVDANYSSLAMKLCNTNFETNFDAQ
jgi:hypothetical protein